MKLLFLITMFLITTTPTFALEPKIDKDGHLYGYRRTVKEKLLQVSMFLPRYAKLVLVYDSGIKSGLIEAWEWDCLCGLNDSLL